MPLLRPVVIGEAKPTGPDVDRISVLAWGAVKVVIHSPIRKRDPRHGTRFEERCSLGSLPSLQQRGRFDFATYEAEPRSLLFPLCPVGTAVAALHLFGPDVSQVVPLGRVGTLGTASGVFASADFFESIGERRRSVNRHGEKGPRD